MPNLLTLSTQLATKGLGSLFRGLGKATYNTAKEFGSSIKQASQIEAGVLGKTKSVVSEAAGQARSAASYGREAGSSFTNTLFSDKTLIGKGIKLGEAGTRNWRSFKTGNPKLSTVIQGMKSASSAMWSTTPGRWITGIGAAGAGLAYGSGSAVMRRYENKQQMRGGMKPNNLGTDGLTLALSKTRHR